MNVSVCMKFVILLGSILIACQQKENKTVHLSDIVPKAKHDSILSSLSDQQNEQKNIDLSFLPLTELKTYSISWDSIYYIDSQYFLDRFSTVETKKVAYLFDNKEFFVFQWTFSDSLKTMTAFLNWMNCFGEHCKTVELYKEENIQQNALFIAIGNSKIIEIQTASAKYSELGKWKKLYENDETQKWNIFIKQRKNEKTEWKTVVRE